MKYIAVIEDDIPIGDMLEEILKKEGYGVMRAYSGTEALLLLAQKQPDLVLLDLMLPGLSGEEVLPRLDGLPVIVVSAKAGVDDKVNLLLDGAADYITKPFSMKILLRKISLVLNRSQSEEKKDYDDGNLYIDWERARIMVGKSECTVTPTEFRLLKILAENKGKLLTYDILLEQLWDCDGQFVDKHTLAVNINRLRKKIEDTEHKYISNVYGMGYQWVG